VRLLATDLDGTIFTRDGGFRQEDIDALHMLGRRRIVRVIATGRTFNSAKEIIPSDFPIDYLVFSSGAGVFDWKSKQILQVKHLGVEKSKEIIPILNDEKVNFTLHWPIPENHCFYYSETERIHDDFSRYLSHYEQYAFSIKDNLPQKNYTQVLAFLPDISTYESLTDRIENIKTVRATSPIDGQSIWMEFFHKGVSKAEGLKFVCELEKVDDSDVVVLGNDFNDLDMLEAYEAAYVVSESPEELRNRFSVVASAYEGALKDVVARILINKNQAIG